MNVIVSNKYQGMLETLDIDIIKIEGTLEAILANYGVDICN